MSFYLNLKLKNIYTYIQGQGYLTEKRFLESNSMNLFQVRLGYGKVPGIEEAFYSKKNLPLTALDPIYLYLLII